MSLDEILKEQVQTMKRIKRTGNRSDYKGNLVFNVSKGNYKTQADKVEDVFT